MIATHSPAELARHALDPLSLHRPAPAGVDWGRDLTLHVAITYFNPMRWNSRRELFLAFVRYMRTLPHIKLYVGELAFRDRPFEVTDPHHPNDYRYRSDQIMWYKENLCNRVIENFDPDWKYGAHCDGDVMFDRMDVGLETVHQLQRYDWVQMFGTYADLSPDHVPLRIVRGAAMRYRTGDLDPLKKVGGANPVLQPNYPRVVATGLAWGFRRDSFEACGRLLDFGILGSGDWHMAFGLMNLWTPHPELTECSEPYARMIRAWQDRAHRNVRGNVGYVKAHAVHYWHGAKVHRGYAERWKILRDHKFDPSTDLYPDANGLYQLTTAKPGFGEAVRGYFGTRNEDATVLGPNDKPLGD